VTPRRRAGAPATPGRPGPDEPRRPDDPGPTGPGYVVDTVTVDPDRLPAYLALLDDLALPLLTGAGARVVTCLTTAADLGEPVSVLVVVGFDDHRHWNEIRRRLVLDPRYHHYAASAAALRRGGTRRFYYPAPGPVRAPAL